MHAGLVILTPLEDAAPSATNFHGHTPIEPPPSILNSVYSALKNVFASSPPVAEDSTLYQPPPPQPYPSYKPLTWGAVDSYGQPAVGDAYQDYDPHNPHPSFAASKLSSSPHKHHHVPISHGLTADKIQKINQNLDKLNAYLNENVQRSSEVLPKFTGMDAYREMMKKGTIPLLPTPVVSDNEIGVLPAEVLDSTTTTSTTTTTTEKPTTTTESEKTRQKKDVKYFLRGNRIVLQG